SARGMRLVPDALAISTSASRHSNAGAVSPEKTAQHLVPPGATWQRSPSFLMQNPHPLRHVSDWLYQRQRVSRHILPPIVPIFRISGEATVLAASGRTGQFLFRTGECSISCNVVSAPIS